MPIKALDHINIITRDLDGTCEYMVSLLGLDRRDAPPPLDASLAQWLYDSEGRALFHINHVDCPRLYDRDVQTGITGAIHHVAVECNDFGGMIARVEGLGAQYQVNEFPSAGLRQIFTAEPNGILFELNFYDRDTPGS